MLHTADNLTQTWTTNNKWIKIFSPKFPPSVCYLIQHVNSRSLLAAASLDVPAKNRCHQSKCSKCGARLMIRSAWCSRWLMLLPHSDVLRPVLCVLPRPFFKHSFHISWWYHSRATAVFQWQEVKKGRRKGTKKKNDLKRETQTCHCGIQEMARYPWAGWRYWILEMRLHRLPPFACGDKNRIDRASEAFAFLRKHAAALLSSNPHPKRASSLPFLSSSLPSCPFLIKCFRTSRVMNLL